MCSIFTARSVQICRFNSSDFLEHLEILLKQEGRRVLCVSHFKFYLAEGFLFFQDCVLTEEFLLFSFPTEKSHLNQRLLNVKNWRAFFKLASLAKIKLSSCARSKIYLFVVYD